MAKPGPLGRHQGKQQTLTAGALQPCLPAATQLLAQPHICKAHSRFVPAVPVSDGIWSEQVQPGCS